MAQNPVAGLNPGAYPTVPGQPSYSGVFIPEVWSSVFLPKFYAASVFPHICNTDYEGQLQNYGDTIYVPKVPDMVIHEYVDGQSLITDRPEAENEIFTVQKGHYFNSLVTDLAQKQSNIAFLDKWSTDVAQKMHIHIDRRLLAEIPADVDSANQGATAGKISKDLNLGTVGTPLQVSRTNAIDVLMHQIQCLQEQDVPTGDGNIFAVIPPWLGTELKLSDLKAVYVTGDSTSTLRTGRIDGIDVIDALYISTNLMPVDDSGSPCYYVLVGHKMATTFASQMTRLETLRSSDTFGTLMRGLQIYDYKVMNPVALTASYITRSTS